MHTFVITEHPEFGKIRTVEKDGKIWFCAKDVAASLGYANTRDAIDRHCKQKGVCVHDIPTTPLLHRRRDPRASDGFL